MAAPGSAAPAVDDWVTPPSPQPVDDWVTPPSSAAAKPPQPGTSFIGAIEKGLENAPAAFERAAGGALRAMGENAVPEPDIPMDENDPQMPDPSQWRDMAAKSADVPGAPANLGKRLFDSATQDLKDNAPNVAPGSVNDYAYQVAQSVPELAAIVGATFLTKSPLPGAAAIAGQAYGEKYGEAREENRTPDQASMDAGFTGLVNGAMASLPLSVVMKSGGTFLAKSLFTAGAMAFQNVATDAIQMGYDKDVIGTQMTLGDAITRLKDAGIVGAVTGAFLGAGAHGVERIAGGGTPSPDAGTPQPEPARPFATPEEAAAPVMAAGSVDDAIVAAQTVTNRAPIDIEAMGAQAQQAAADAADQDDSFRDPFEDFDAAPPDEERTPAPAPGADTGEIEPAPEDGAPEPDRDAAEPSDVATFLAAMGGIHNDDGYDLAAGRRLQQFVPGVGPLIRPGGMSLEAAGDALHEAGFFGPPDSTPQPDPAAVIDLLDQTGRGPDGLPTKVFAPAASEAAPVTAPAPSSIEADNTASLQGVHDQAHAVGEPITDDEAHQILENIVAHGIDPESAVAEHIERKAIRGAYLGDEGEHAGAAENEPVTGAAGGADLEAGTVGERPEHVVGDANGTQPPSEPVAKDTSGAHPVTPGPRAVDLNRPIVSGEHDLFGTPDPTPMFSRREAAQDLAPPFFSALTRGVEGVKLDKATPGQWEATIRNIPGVKGDEVAWSGVNDWLRQQTKSVTKVDILAHLKENEVGVQEVEKGNPEAALSRQEAGELSAIRAVPWQERNPLQRDRLHALEDKMGAGNVPKYAGHTLPGGENYRELLLTAPGKSAEEIAAAAEKVRERSGVPGGRLTQAEYNRAGARGLGEFRSSHFDEPNVLAHVRFDDRTGPNGEKVLHVAEVQSDWHQKGRKQGYASDKAAAREDYKRNSEERMKIIADAGGRGEAIDQVRQSPEFQALEREQAEIKERMAGSGVPDAPFKSTWHELAMKRMLRYAAEHGYDRLSWDTGQTAADRFDLSKQISRVAYEKSGTSGFNPLDQIERLNEGQGLLTAHDHNGREVLNQYIRDEKTVPDYIGKEAAEKLLNQKPKLVTRSGTATSSRELSGLDLKVGGEGMKGFYDRILPQFMSKYVRKWGAHVETSTLPGEKGAGGTGWESTANRYDTPAKAVHSVPITDAMRDSVMQGQPLFARDGERAPLTTGNVRVTGTFAPEFDAQRGAVAGELRRRLNDLGLRDIALKLPDAINLQEGDKNSRINGAYAQKIIAVALDGTDHFGTLDHEAIHAVRELGLLSTSEWSILANRAARDWRSKFDIDKRYAGLPEDRLNEEAVAEAFRAWVKDRSTQEGFLARIFDKVRNALSSIGSVLRGRGFTTAESIFGELSRGEVGARPRGIAEAGEPQFSRRDQDAEPAAIPPEEIMYRDGVSNLIDAVTGGRGGDGRGPTIPERLLNVAATGARQLKNLNPLEVDFPGSIFPRTLATLDSKSARLWNAWTARDEEGHANAEKLRQVVSDSLVTLPADSRDRVYAAIELARKWDFRPPDDGNPIRVRNSTFWQARKSKVGDDYVLSPAETKAFHDTMRLGDEGWRTFMTAMARREGWMGAPEPKAIMAAANGKGATGLPEGKRLIRLATALTLAQEALKHPYFPASRFGDYFVAVKPKMGADMFSTGGYPQVQWFETVEKPLMSDILGKARTAAKDMQGVKDAIARIRAMKKPDGMLAFPEATHDIETGDMRSRPDVLRKLNIPAIEKLFMLMERGTTSSLQSRIIADGTPEVGIGGKGARQLKAGAKEDAKARYQALLGETKDTLLDAMYQDLLAGWKKQANFTPGYSADFDRAIGTHIGQISKNAATMVHHNAIEGAYQDIQDNHPHQSVKDYWRHWRDYQDSPRSPLSRAAANTAQLGAAYVMAMNPSTTLMIAAHAPMMAVPVLGVGSSTGHAALHMLRATREAYAGLSFDTKKGASIDTSRLGKTPGEKAMIAELERTGMNHSVGANDVRAINDRQAGLWGQAAPVMRRALDIAMSNVSVVDQANRNAIALSAYRMASNPAVLEKMAAPWMEHNAVFREMVLDQGLTPENFTKFMMSEAGGAWGKTNQAPMMRGTEGSLLFALHGFQTRYLSTAYRLMRHMGPEGRVAAAWMMAGLALGAGAMGLPFTQDAENAGDALLKKINGVDPMIDAHIRQFMADAGFGKIGSEILMRGPLSVLSGVDFGSRIGFGDILSRTFSEDDLLGTVPSILWERASAAWNRERSGQGVGAAAAELLPAALRNPARATIEADQGQLSADSTMEMTAKQITPVQQALRAVGLPTLASSQARARSDYLYRLQHRDDDLRKQTETAAASLIMRANKAYLAGDQEMAHDLSQQMATLLSDYNREHRQAPVTHQGLDDAMLQMTNPEIYQKSRLSHALRGEAQGSPYP